MFLYAKGLINIIEAMRALGLDYLAQQFKVTEENGDIESWYRNFRLEGLASLFPYLIEDTGKIETAYIIEPTEEISQARMTVYDISVSSPLANNQTATLADKIPFMRPSGSQSAQIGPVIKRSYSKENGAGPSAKILNTTMKYFEDIADGDKPWAAYFRNVINVLNREELCLPDGSIVHWAKAGYTNMLTCAVEKIGPQSNTVILTVRTEDGQLPGDCQQYLDYLLIEKLAGERYVTGDAKVKEKACCPVCDETDTQVYPNALKGAGINLTNADRIGVFPGITAANAWKKYALCGSCADLLYVYKYHVLKKIGRNHDKQPFSARIAGDSALIIPVFIPGVTFESRLEILKDVKIYIEKLDTDVEEAENSLLDLLKESDSIMNFIFLWADLGQNLDNITGMIANVLPSRLRELSIINNESRKWKHALFPKFRVAEKQFDFRPDLQLKALRDLFSRPGGKKTQSLNSSAKLTKLKRDLAAAIYLNNPVQEKRFWEEVIITARAYITDAITRGEAYPLLYEGEGKKGPFLTMAGWVKNMNWWLYYLKRIGGVSLETNFYQPKMQALQPFFGLESGIDSNDKAYAFMLGVLYGKLLQVQGARNVNVGSNALTWLKRLTLKGRDLPELYIKIREKFLAYNSESKEVRELLTELGAVAVLLGDKIDLTEIQANYYLLLGQSMSTTILPIKEK